MKTKKNIILFVAGLLVAGSFLSGCTQQGLAVTIVPQNIGDEVTYSLKMTNTQSSFSSTTIINGTIFTKVNGTKTIVDGFGTEQETIELYTKTKFEQGQNIGYELSTNTLSYLDPESKFPMKTVTNMNMGIMAMSFEFYVSEKMYDFLYSSLSTLGSLGISPNDILSAFQEKSIKKGGTGTITIANMTITWTALGDEKVKDYDCVKIQFSLPINALSQEGASISITCDYTVWLASSFPSLIKMSGTITSVTTGTLGNYQTSIAMDMLLESSKRGATPISWGSSEPSFPEQNSFGEYTEWSFMPGIGTKTSSITFTPEEALTYAQENSPDLASYLVLHPNAYATSCKYGRINNTETWELSLRDETMLGYDIKLSYDGVEATITSEEPKTYLTKGSLKSSLSILTFSGCENIFSQYGEIVQSTNMQIQFFSDMASQISSSGNIGGLSLSMFELFPDSVYMISIGDISGATKMTSIIIDAETGQIIMLYTIQGFGGII